MNELPLWMYLRTQVNPGYLEAPPQIIPVDDGVAAYIDATKQ
jgi:hypothetical protein